MIDPFTLAQTHPSLETHTPVQTHTMLEKTEACSPPFVMLILTTTKDRKLKAEREAIRPQAACPVLFASACRNFSGNAFQW